MRRFGVVLVMVLAGACQQGVVPEEGTPPQSSGGLDPNLVNPPPTGANANCNDLTPGGSIITDQRGAAVPALNGGTLVDGRYILTRYEWYTPNDLHTRSITLVISGGGTAGQYLWTRDQDPQVRTSLSIATSGSQIALRATCPVGADLEWDQYGMTDSGMTLYSSRDTKAAFFSRQ